VSATIQPLLAVQVSRAPFRSCSAPVTADRPFDPARSPPFCSAVIFAPSQNLLLQPNIRNETLPVILVSNTCQLFKCDRASMNNFRAFCGTDTLVCACFSHMVYQ